jgi:hypothetical protein
LTKEQKERVHLPHPIACQFCIEKNRNKCYTHAVGDTATLALAIQCLLSMVLNHPHLADATMKEKLNIQVQQEPVGSHARHGEHTV